MKRNAIILPLTILMIAGLTVMVSLYQHRSIKSNLQKIDEIEKIKFAIQLSDVEELINMLPPQMVEHRLGKNYNLNLLNNEKVFIDVEPSEQNVPIDVVSEKNLYSFFVSIARNEKIYRSSDFAERLINDIKVLKEVNGYDQKNIQLAVDEIVSTLGSNKKIRIENYISVGTISSDLYKLSDVACELFFEKNVMRKIKIARDNGSVIDSNSIDSIKKIELTKLGIIMDGRSDLVMVKIKINKKTKYVTKRGVLIYNLKRGKIVEKYNN